MCTMRMGLLLIVVTLLSGLLGSTGVLAQSGAQVTGTLTYLPRIALPDDAVVNVQLQEVSRADAPATVLAEQEFVTEGAQVPLPFALDYDPAGIAEQLTYVVRATIRANDGQLLWTTDTFVPVITQGNPTSEIEIVLVQAISAEVPDIADEFPVAALNGSLTYLQFIALPDDAVVFVQLEQVPLNDEPTLVLGSQEFATEGSQVPFAFSISYNPDLIDAQRTYVVQAGIAAGDGQLLWVTPNGGFPVLTQGNPSSDFEIVLVQVVPETAPDPTPEPTTAPAPNPAPEPEPTPVPPVRLPVTSTGTAHAPLVALLLFGAVLVISGLALRRTGRTGRTGRTD